VNPKDEGDSLAEASRLLVFDAIHNSVPTTIRDGVGIDRASGAAARTEAAKFDMEVLPSKTNFELRLELREGDEMDQQLLAAALAEWKEGRAWLGGRVARGLGAFQLKDDLRCVQLNLNKADQLMAFLREDEPWKGVQQVPDWLVGCVEQVTIMPSDVPGVAHRWITAEFTLKAEGPMLTNDTAAAGISGFDHAPLLASTTDWEHPTLPGASLRGVLRSHAERIARTLATLNASSGEEFLQKCPACSPLVRSSEKEPKPALESCDSLLKKNKVPTTKEVDQDMLCLACWLFGSTRYGSRLIVEDAPFVGDRPCYKMLDFLAIDRFTGGGAEHLKFDALALWQPSFHVHLHLDNPDPWELGWLALVLRDLREGWLNVGFGAAKGFGRVRIVDGSWKLRLGFLGDDGLGLPATTTSGVYQVAEFNPSTQPHWSVQVVQWVNEFNQKITAFERCDTLCLEKDSFFGRVEQFYPNG
jgi:CRISPR/Cas system CSM-associated protein Csm3 (group 7 of RAMP superfamily)